MQYAASLPFRGDAEKAFCLAESALTALGFRLDARTPARLELLGPGMNSSRESPLVGASRIELRSGEGKLSVEAELGGVVRVSRFVTLFPICLVLSLGIVFSTVFGLANGAGLWMGGVVGAVGVNAVVWIFLGPLMARKFRSRTERALDTLLANMVAVGDNS